MTMPAYDYALIIPAWNEAEYIQLSIAAAQQAMKQVDYSGQLIVVDNNSSDNTGELASSAGAQVVFEAINQISRARNAGAAAATAGIYVFVDADSSVTSALLAQALDAVTKQNKVGGGANIRIDQDVSPSVDAGVRFWNWISRRFNVAAGCFVFCRADAFHAVDGFSLKRYAGEELVLSRALRRWGRKRGMRFLIITDPTIETSARKMEWYTTRQLLRQTLLAMLPGALNSKRFMRTWYDESIRRTRNDK